MGDVKKCEICDKLFIPRNHTQKTCGANECKRKLNNKLSMEAYYRNRDSCAVEKNKNERKNKSKETNASLVEIAKKAKECGMTYGQYVASIGKE